MSKILKYILIGVLAMACGSNKDTQWQEEEVAVATAIVKPGVVDQPDRFSGRLLSAHRVSLSTKLVGRIDRLDLEIGDKFKKGDVLVSLSDGDLKAKRIAAISGLKEAEANFEKVTKDHQRIKTLFEKGSATEKELDDISYALEASQAKVSSLKSSLTEVNDLLTYANIRAPFDGFVTDKQMEAGDITALGRPILTIESFQKLKVVAKVPEHQLGLLEVGDEVEVELETLSRTVDGIVSQINPSSVSGNLQFETIIEIEAKSAEGLKSGLYAEVIIKNQRQDMVLLPLDDIVTKGQLKGVYTVNNQERATLRWLRLGEVYEDQVEVLSGLRIGEEYIASADSRLVGGVKVKVKN